MLQSCIGVSKMTKGYDAGREAAEMVSKSLTRAGVLFVYFSCAYETDQVLKGIREVFPNVPVVGNTSFTGVITNQGFLGGEDPFVGILGLFSDRMSVGTAMIEGKGNPFAEGKKLAESAQEAAGMKGAPDYFYMAASPGEEEFYVKGISSVIGRVPFFGGSAADNSISGEWKLYAGNESCGNGAAVAFFYNAPAMTNLFTGAYRETEDYGIITRVSGNRTLMEIDGVPAVQKYAEWTGRKMEDLMGGNLLVSTICSPLGVKDRLGDLTAIRHPMNGNDDLSMAIGNNLAEKTCVIRMEATVDELIASAPDTLRKLKEKMPKKAAAYHLVHCGGRRAGIGDRINEVAEALMKEAGDIPFIVEFTFGEYGYESDNNNTCGGLMLSFTGFFE